MNDDTRPISYEALEADAMAKFAEADYDGALALLDEHADRFPANRANSVYLRSCLLVRGRDAGAAIGVLREAMDAGLWYSEPILRQSPSLQPLQGHHDYESLVAGFAERAPAETSAEEPAVVRPDGPLHGVLVALHGNGQTARDALEAWQAVAADGWAVAAPFSSQMLHSAGAVWDDAATAQADVERQAGPIRQLATGGIPTVVAGFSLGADVGLAAVLSGLISARGVLLVGPPALLLQDAAWPSLLDAAAKLRAHVMLGTDDVAVSGQAVDSLVEALRGAGATVQLDRIEGLAHAYPPFETRRVAVEALARDN